MNPEPALIRFEGHVLDTARRELRRGADLVAMEPQVFDLLVYLIEHRDRVVTKDDLLAAIWGGRIVSESTLSSRINAVRRAVGDSGESQALIRTVPRKGLRFVGTVDELQWENGARPTPGDTATPPEPQPRASPDTPVPDDASVALPPSRRASVAVMPFLDLSAVVPASGGAADALAHDVITRLAKLRSLFVIAQGTMFALHERGVGVEEAGRLLHVEYTVGGSVRRSGARLTVSVELTETRTARIVWADTLDHTLDDAFLVLDEIGNQIVAAVASEIEATERNHAILKPPSSLDAWEALHRGLWHAYRFNAEDNAKAHAFFAMAARLDPTFSRAYAGLSFTHWQNAFQGWADRATETERAYAAAGQSLMADDRDPAAHLAMGRALWLRDRPDQSVTELEQAVALSPNFALGHYSLAFVHSQNGDPQAAIAYSDQSRHLSPFDPLLFGMLGTRAMALMALGRVEEAAEWAVKSAARPNAHAHITALAAFSLALVGRLEEAHAYLAAVRLQRPLYRFDDFLAAFRYGPECAKLFGEGARRLGMR